MDGGEDNCFLHKDTVFEAETMNKEETKYYIVDSKALPDVLLKTAYAKYLLGTGKATSVSDALIKVDISRSAFYKYRDAIMPFIDASSDKIVTIQATLLDEAGVLSGLINLFAKFNVNILTINQAVPVNGQAVVTVSVRTSNMYGNLEQLAKHAEEIPGVLRLELLASE